MNAHNDAAHALAELLCVRLSAEAMSFLANARCEISHGVSTPRLSQLLSLASRYVHGQAPLLPDPDEMRMLDSIVADWDPAQWSLLDSVRIALLLAWPDASGDSFGAAYEHCFRFADQREAIALYRSLPLLPRGQRFLRRAYEGCRSNMKPIFEAVACDSPYPVRHFDDTAWRQLVIKAVFIETPLWRVVGFDQRLSPELARMALDFVDERRSANRPVPPQVWMCLGNHCDDRALHELKELLTHEDCRSQRAALLAIARAGALDNGSEAVRLALVEHTQFVARAHGVGLSHRAIRYI